VGTVDDVDKTKPVNATDTGASLGGQIRDLKDAIINTWDVEHFKTGEHKFKKGTTAARPGAGKAGRIYYNDTTKTIQHDDGSSWSDLGYYKITVSSYTGDGAAAKSITGIGYAPSAVFIVRIDDGAMFFKSSVFAALDTANISTGTITTDAIDTLDSDGFGVSVGLNTNGKTYAYIALP